MLKTEKERVVADLTEKLRATDTLIVADYRGLTNKQLEQLRARLVEHGARLSVVKNTLTRRAAEAAGAEALLALLEGPTAIAFIESSGDPAAVAKALADTAKETKVLALKGGILEGRALSDAEVDELAKLPPTDVLRAQLVGVIVAPLTQLVGLLHAPLRDLVGLIDARIAQLSEGGAEDAGAAPADAEAAPPDAADATEAATADATEPGDPAADDETEAAAPPEAEAADDDSADSASAEPAGNEDEEE
jgi:large subunit ribosomal protein L10